MPRVREHLIEEKNRHGTTRHLFHRRPNGRRTTIKGQPGEPAFEARYEFLVNGGDMALEVEKASISRQRNHDSPYLIRELVRLHCSHLDNLVKRGELSKYTQKHYQRFTRRFSDQYGDASLHTVEARHLERVLEDWSTTSNTWNNALRAFKHLFKYADKTWGIKPNPTAEIAKKHVETDGHRPWDDHNLTKFFAHHKIGSNPYLSMMLLIHTTPRRADLVKLEPANIVIENGQEFIRFLPQKSARNSHTTVTMPLHPDLKAAIEATLTGDETFLITVFGKPYSADGFSNHILDWRRAAGITESVSAHGMRKTVGINMAENGATEYELMATLGHTNPKATEVYTRAANRRRLSTQAASKSTLSNILKLSETD